MATSEEGAAPAGAELTIPQMGVVEQVLVVE